MALEGDRDARRGAGMHTPPPGGPMLQENIKAFSERFVTHFYQHDWRWCLPYCDRDIEYFGSTWEGVERGVDNLRDLMRSTLSRYNISLPVVVDMDVFVFPDETAALVTLRYYLVTDPSDGQIRSRRKRGTLLWLIGDEGPRLRHLHFSTPLVTDIDQESLPEASHESVAYARTLIEHLVKTPDVTLRDVDGSIQRISSVEVRYVEASGRLTVIHLLERDVLVREPFVRAVSQLGPNVVPIHRSFAVNLTYVRTVRSDGVVLDDRTFVPIPQRRSREVRDQLEQALHALRPHVDGLLERTKPLP